MEEKKDKRGGKRPGAGRPRNPEHRVPLTVYVSPEIKDMAFRMKFQGLDLSSSISAHIRGLYGHRQDLEEKK